MGKKGVKITLKLHGNDLKISKFLPAEPIGTQVLYYFPFIYTHSFNHSRKLADGASSADQKSFQKLRDDKN